MLDQYNQFDVTRWSESPRRLSHEVFGPGAEEMAMLCIYRACNQQQIPAYLVQQRKNKDEFRKMRFAAAPDQPMSSRSTRTSSSIGNGAHVPRQSFPPSCIECRHNGQALPTACHTSFRVKPLQFYITRDILIVPISLPSNPHPTSLRSAHSRSRLLRVINSNGHLQPKSHRALDQSNRLRGIF